MDLSGFTIRDVFLSAIKEEVEASKMYRTMIERTKDEHLKDRLLFLSKEEMMHAKMLKRMYLQEYPEDNIELEKDLPEHTTVPLPPMIDINESTTVEEVFLASGYTAVVFVSDLINRHDIVVKTALAFLDKENTIRQYNMAITTARADNENLIALGLPPKWDISKLTEELLRQFDEIIDDISVYQYAEGEAPIPPQPTKKETGTPPADTPEKTTNITLIIIISVTIVILIIIVVLILIYGRKQTPSLKVD